MKKIKEIYGAHPILWTLLLLVILAIACYVGYYAPSFRLSAAEIPTQTAKTSAIGESVPIGGTVEVAHEGGRTLTLDTEELVFTLTDDATGTTWSSAVNGAKEGIDKALLRLYYLGEDNNLLDWNTYDNCVAFGSYNLYQLANGVRIEMNVNEGDSKEFFEYLPQRIPIDRYEEFIQPAIAQLDETLQSRYNRALKMVYTKRERENAYVLTSAGKPPVSASAQLIEMTRAIGYTREMLIEDCAEFGVTPEFHEPAIFDLVLELTLDNGQLVARLPSQEMQTGNDYYQIQRVCLLPNFGSSAAADKQDGYFLTPDGAGALMQFNTFGATVPEYVRPYLDNDYYTDYYYQSEYPEELMTPVFGALYGGMEADSGLLAIIEQGVETANLHVSIAATTGSGCNKIYPSVDVLEYTKVKIYGAYADNGATYLSDSGHINVDFTVRYYPYAQQVTYFDMAETTRAYLAEKTGVTIEEGYDANLYVEAIGAVTMTEHVLGVPYDAIRSMTTYMQLAEMSDALPEGAAIQYDGAFNGGIVSELNDGARLVSENGTKEELEAVLKTATEKGQQVFLQANLSRVYRPGRTYRPSTHALRDFGNETAEIYPYASDTAKFDGRSSYVRYYTRVSPRYLADVAEKFLKEYQALQLTTGLAAEDLGHDVFVDYRYRNIINPVAANTIVEGVLESLKEESLTLSNPDARYAPLTTFSVDVSRRSSEYTSFALTIPFRQLVLRGLTTVATEDVNLNSRSLDYYLCQAAELGTWVKYKVTYENSDVLKSSHFESLYAVQWDEWQAEIEQAAQALSEMRDVLGGQTITGHRMLTDEVAETTYSGGAVVLTNYSALPYEAENGEVIAPVSYQIFESGMHPVEGGTAE